MGQQIIAYTGLINAVANIGMGSFFLISNPRSPVVRSFALWCYCVAFWAINYFWTFVADSRELALYYSRLLNLGALFIPALFTLFVLRFTEKRNKWIHIVNLAICLLIIPFVFTDLYVKEVVPKLFFQYWPMPGPLYHVMLVYFFINGIYAHYILWRGWHESSGIRRRQVRLIFWGTLIGFLAGATNFFLFYNIPIPPVFNIVVSFYGAVIAYAIIRYKLMGIQLTSAEKEKLKATLAVSSSINHEIRNPLGFILADARSLFEKVEGVEDDRLKVEMQTILQQVRKNAEHVIEVTKTMTRFARPVKDKTEFTAVDIRECAEAAVRQFREGMEGSEKISVEITSECCEGEKVLGDTVFIRESLRNFLENAAYGIRQANREDGTISIRISPVGRKHIAVSVTDNGCGIPKEDLTRVFDMDYSTRKDGFKHGAGMFLVKWYADQMKAELNIESTEGVGTTVSLSLQRGDK